MRLVDTNILAFLLLEGPLTLGARRLLSKDNDWRSESFVLIELANVLTTAMRVRGLALRRAEAVLFAAQHLIEPGLYAVAHADALTLASRYSITAYDARFLVVAQDLGTRLVTEDNRLRAAAPDLTQSLAEALA